MIICNLFKEIFMSASYNYIYSFISKALCNSSAYP